MEWSLTQPSSAIEQMYKRIVELHSTKHRVLLLVSGGSALSFEAELLEKVSGSNYLLGVLPIDERYGKSDHEHSNIAQLMSLVSSTTIPIYDVLKSNLPFAQTIDHYSTITQDLFSKADCIIGILGIGTDGHTAGILPGSPATTDTISTIVGYNWSDYDRMTLGIDPLLKMNESFVFAYGENKKTALEKLHKNIASFTDLPAKILYDIPRVTIYNDYIKSEGK